MPPNEQTAFAAGIQASRQAAMTAAVTIEVRDDAREIRQQAAAAALHGLAAGLSPADTRRAGHFPALETDARRVVHPSWVDTREKVPPSFVPTIFSVPMMTTATKAAIMSYSIAVAPDSSEAKRIRAWGMIDVPLGGGVRTLRNAV